MEILFIGWSIAVVVEIFIIVIASKRSVKNRSFIAKRMIIGKDTDEVIEKMAAVANDMYESKNLNLSTEVLKDLPELSISYKMQKGEIKSLTIKSERTRIEISEDGCNINSDIAWSEKSARVYIAIQIFSVFLCLDIFGGMLTYVLYMTFR